MRLCGSFLYLTICLSMVLPSSIYSQNTADSQFKTFSDFFLSNYWALNPVSATFNGLNEYNDQLTIPSAPEYQRQINKYNQFLTLLRKNDFETLSTANKTDYLTIENLLEKKLWYLKDFKAYEWNPTVHNIGGQLDKVLKSEQALPEKMAAISKKMVLLPTYFKALENIIKDPTLEHTQLAINQNNGSMTIFDEDIPQLIKDYTDSGEGQLSKEELNTQLSTAKQSFNSYITWLQSELGTLKDNPDRRNFRLEDDLYARKFDLEMVSAFSAEEIFQIALKEKEQIHEKMKELTKSLSPQYLGKKIKKPTLKEVRQLIDKLADNHVKRDKFVESVKKQIPELEQFVKEKDLIDLDLSKPLKVRETPSYMRGVAGASITAPGPYEKERPTFYNVTPLDHYTDEEAESYLREYNDYILQILNIHEAVPGHYTQLVHANQSPSLIKSLFGNVTMIEGWACYVERMMLEEGYGGNEPEMWLMYYKWNLRELCNALIDIGIHTKGWEEDYVINLLVNEAFQEQTEAEGKWKRATLSQVQLCSYYTGLTEIYNFREKLKKQMKDKFNLKVFHNQFLSYGSIPVSSIKKLFEAEESN